MADQELETQRASEPMFAPPEVEREHEHDDGPQALASQLGNANVARLATTSVQRSGGSSMGLDETVAREIDSRRGGGAALPGGVRETMESGFGTDFSNVRVHTDSAAHDLSEQVEAKAFTVGNDIFFKGGNYNPSSSDGQHLLAHELTHVVQQQGATGAPTSISDPGDHAEHEADAVADEVLGSANTAPSADAAPAVARMEEDQELDRKPDTGSQVARVEDQDELEN